MTVRVRFAPSPTGFLHIGGARTALYNWLFARRHKGTFILRIEDTDENRSTQESVNAIFQGLRWMELDWDEGPIPHDEVRMSSSAEWKGVQEKGGHGPYFQMQRLSLYRQAAGELIASGNAYPCYCTADEVQKMREKATAQKLTPKYDGTCRNLTPEQRKAKEAEGRKASVRFKSPAEGKINFIDVIRGPMEFEANLMEDFVLLKSSGVPTYNFACVVDDHHMGITHVIRGDDHLSNTPRQVLVYRAMGWTPPVFAHLSMILGSDGSRLSKRHGAASVQEYEQAGYLPGALRNYLALLGWSTEESQQLFGPEELIEKFTLERCSKSPAVFDPDKLLWMNGEYARAMPAGDLAERALPFLEKAGLSAPREKLEALVALEHEKIKLLTDVPARIDIFLKDVGYDKDSVDKVFKKPGVAGILKDALLLFEHLEPFTAASTEAACKKLAEKRGLKNAAVFHPIRVAVSGRTQGPSLFHMLEILGKAECLKRLKSTLDVFPSLVA